MRLAWMIPLLVAACASTPPTRSTARDTSTLDATLAEYAGHDGAPGRTRRLAAVVSPRTIRAPQRAPARRAGRRRRIDVRFADADLGNALGLLAAAGGFSLVADGLPAQRVTISLRGVDPYDALVAIAKAGGVSVRNEGALVVVSANR